MDNKGKNKVFIEPQVVNNEGKIIPNNDYINPSNNPMPANLQKNNKIRANNKTYIFILLGLLLAISLGFGIDYILQKQQSISKITFNGGVIEIYKSNSTVTGPLTIGDNYEAKINFDLVNKTDETQTIEITIVLKYVGVSETGNFQGVQFSSFKSDGSGTSTTVILTYDLPANATTTKEIVIPFFPTAVTNSMTISVIPNSSDDKIDLQARVIMGQN